MPISSPDPTGRKPRADAQRNRERILEVAKTALTRLGANVSLDEVAKEAGVGAGTLYRHFPTRDALLEAVYRNEVGKLAGAARTFAETMAPADWWGRAIESGDVRPDMEPLDLLRALVGVSNVASMPDWPQSARRLVDILIAGSRPEAGKEVRVIDEGPGDVIQRINQAWLQGRLEELEQLIDPDIVMAIPGFVGSVRGKAAFLAGFAEFIRTCTVHEFRELDQSTDRVGDVAVNTFRYEMLYERDGGRYRSLGRDLWVLQQKEGGWRAVWRAMLDMAEQQISD